MNPEKQKYYGMVYEEVDLRKMFAVNVDDVFIDDDAQEAAIQMNFLDYLRTIFGCILNRINEIEDKGEKKFLKLQSLFTGPSKIMTPGTVTPMSPKTPPKNTRDRGMQTLAARKRGIDVATMVEDDLAV